MFPNDGRPETCIFCINTIISFFFFHSIDNLKIMHGEIVRFVIERAWKHRAHTKARRHARNYRNFLSLFLYRVDAKTTILTLFQRSFRFFNLSAVNRALTTGKRFEIRTICRRIRCAERVDRGTAVSHFVNMRINRHDFRANPHDDGEEI